jgi:hypothetical protein
MDLFRISLSHERVRNRYLSAILSPKSSNSFTRVSSPGMSKPLKPALDSNLENGNPSLSLENPSGQQPSNDDLYPYFLPDNSVS